MALRIEGYVIVSADGMLADARNVMPDELKFEGDKAFFTAALHRADLILHGRNSYEDQPSSPRRRRIFLTRTVEGIAPDPDNKTVDVTLTMEGEKRKPEKKETEFP